MSSTELIDNYRNPDASEQTILMFIEKKTLIFLVLTVSCFFLMIIFSSRCIKLIINLVLSVAFEMKTSALHNFLQNFQLFSQNKILKRFNFFLLFLGSNIFFELRSSSDNKTKYFATLKREDFTNGKGYLELYKGPVDYHMKQLRKVSQKKPLYCHINMTLLAPR